MNTNEIELQVRRCREARKLFKGVFSSDQLPYFNNAPYSFIANCDGHDSPGSHWVAFYIHDAAVEFFDSYGRSPYDQMFPSSFGSYVNKLKCIYNTRILEGLFDNTCGQFCIYFICKRAFGSTYKDLLNSFSSDMEINNSIVHSFLK